ncbi:MAG: hypothetical protein JWM73_1228, partial [Solirubrobacterales bacterium]|nr:hypothetical protein [Solirubrobacterales bacterium]
TGRRVHDVVCLFVAEAAGDGGASGCYTAEQIRRGAVQGGLGSVFYALVPDGVAGVVLRDDDGMRTVEVHDNFYEDAGTRGPGPVPRRVRVLRWLDAEGQPAVLQPTSP